MPQFVAFLRAINVGGHVVTMDQLKKSFVAAGLAQVETFIASGNVIFRSSTRDPAALEARLEKHLHQALGYEVKTFLRTGAEVAAVAAYQPFKAAAIKGAPSFCVGFVAVPLTAAATKALMTFKNDVDDFHVHGREIYWLGTLKQSDSKFSNARMEKALKISATFRGLNTIHRLVARYGFTAVLALSLLTSGTRALGAQATAAIRGDPTIVSPTARVEQLFGEAFFTEGPAQAPDGSVYFSDITFTRSSGGQAGHIWRWDPRTGATTIFRSPSGMANGITFDLEGRMLAALGADFGGRAIVRTDLATGKSTIIAGLYNGRRLNSPNDLVVDARGRIYFTDPRYSGHETVDQPVQGVYRIDPDGRLTLIAANAGKPNGIAVSPDQRTLYVASLDFNNTDDLPPATPAGRGVMALLAYDLAADGSLSNRRVLVDFAPGLGPDGISVDQGGNIYCAIPGREQGIHVFSPEGREIAWIPTPESPTNVKFGRGADANVLFITAHRSLYRVRVERQGYHPGP